MTKVINNKIDFSEIMELVKSISHDIPILDQFMRLNWLDPGSAVQICVFWFLEMCHLTQQFDKKEMLQYMDEAWDAWQELRSFVDLSNQQEFKS